MFSMIACKLARTARAQVMPKSSWCGKFCNKLAGRTTQSNLSPTNSLTKTAGKISTQSAQCFYLLKETPPQEGRYVNMCFGFLIFLL